MAAALPIDERLETAGQLALRARIFFDISWFYEGADTRPQILDTMNEYPEFFRFDTHAHFVSFIVHIAALFENRPNTINLPRLANELGTSQLIPSETFAKVEALLAQASILAQKVTILRSNLFAHRNDTLTYANAFKKAAITSNQLRDLTEIALEIVNQLLIARGLGEKFFAPFPRAHVEAMLNTLSRNRPSVGDATPP